MGKRFKDSDFKEVVPSPFVKFEDGGNQIIVDGEKVGDSAYFKLISQTIQENNQKPGAKQVVYTLETEDGKEVRFSKGNIGEKTDISPAMKKIVAGQWFKLVYEGQQPAKPGKKGFKLVKVYEGPIDEVDQLAADMGGAVVDEDGLPPM